MDEKTIFYTLCALFFYYQPNQFQQIVNKGFELFDVFFNYLVNFLKNDIFQNLDE
jgi:hypothetical protein